MTMHYKSGLLFMFALATVAASSTIAFGQDPTVIDSAHYKVDFENDLIRVLRINYLPGEKGKMHSHPASYAVFVTDGTVRQTLPDGSSQEIEFKAGQTTYAEPGAHLGENVGDTPFEVLQIEFKHE